jgi:methylenetetrahydrofolate dehydrogenase (NADP+) / methenyltetrahydrofolate cyclohydrolase
MKGLLRGQPIASTILKDAETRMSALRAQGKPVKLVVILVGDDAPSRTYVEKKGEMAQKIGIDFTLIHLPTDSSTDDVIAKVDSVQSDPLLSGIIVQLPLPKHIDTVRVLESIDPLRDVDCLTETNLGKIVNKTHYLLPPTPSGVFSFLESLNVDVTGKNVTILGAGPLVGKPLAIMMMNARASITVCNSATKDTRDKCLSADIIVTGIGKKHILTADMVREDAIVIDTGVNFEDGKMYGDVDYRNISEKALVTPTPGGSGPLTVAHLIMNTVVVAERSK